MPKNLEYKAAIYVFIFFLCFYFLLDDGHFDSVEELQVFQTTQSLLTKGDLTISPIAGAMQGVGGSYFSQKGILTTILLVPFYLAGYFLKAVLPQVMQNVFANPLFSGDYNSMFGGGIVIHFATFFNVFITSLLCALYCILCFRLKFSKKASLLVTFILGVSTVLCYYSQALFTHTLACLLLLAIFYSLILHKNNLHTSSIVWAGVFTGLAILTRFELTAVIPLCLWYIAAGNGSFSFKDLTAQVFNKYRLFLIPIFIAVVIRCCINYIKFGLITFSGFSDMADFDGYVLEGLYGNLISVGRSIFIYSPPLIISLFYFKRFLKGQKNEAAFSLALAFLYVFYYSSIVIWHGGMCWGNRYLLILVPFLLLPLNYIAEDYFEHKIKLPFYLMLLFVFLGVLVQAIGMTPNFSYVFIKYNLADLYDGVFNFIYIPERCQLALHLRTILHREIIDYWIYNLYKNYGFLVMMSVAAIPLLGMAVSVRGVFRIINNSDEDRQDLS